MQPNIHDIFEKPAYRNVVDLLKQGLASEAKSHAEKLVAQGDIHGYALLGTIYEFGGAGVTPNADAALRNYTIAIEAEGVIEAALGYARIKYLGKDGVADVAEALRIYEKLADHADDQIAHYMAAKILLESSEDRAELARANIHAARSLASGNLAAKGLMLFAAYKRGDFVQWLRWAGSILFDRLLGRRNTRRLI